VEVWKRRGVWLVHLAAAWRLGAGRKKVEGMSKQSEGEREQDQEQVMIAQSYCGSEIEFTLRTREISTRR
jgi:hypothetical protein